MVSGRRHSRGEIPVIPVAAILLRHVADDTTGHMQTIILVMSKVLPLSEVKARLSEIVDEVVTTQERVTVTRNGRPVAVLVSSDDFETIEETLAILSDPAAMREIEQGRAAIAAGDVVPQTDIESLRDRLRARAG